MADDSSHETSRIAGRFATAQTVWTLVVAVLWLCGMLSLSADQDYTSGELLDHLLAWMKGEALYPDPQQLPYRVFNYPPLGIAAVRALAELGVPALLAGRLFGTAGVVAALWVVYRWMREAGVSSAVARGTIALAGLSFPLLYSTGQFHLEGFAVLLTLIGAREVWRGSRNDKPMNFVLAGVLMASACFVKQTQVFSVGLVVMWMLVHRRQSLFAFAFPAIAAGVVGAALTHGFFGEQVWRHVITYTVGTYSLGNLSLQLTSHALPWLAFATLAWYHSFKNDVARKDFLTWYLGGSSLLLLTSARIGSGFQYFLEWQLLVLLLIAPALQQFVLFGRSVRRPLLASVLVTIVALNAGVMSFLAYNWRLARHTELAFQNLCAFAPEAPMLTPTENLGAARACGLRPALNPFIIANLTDRQLWNESDFVNDLLSARYPAIIVPFNPSHSIGTVQHERWSPAVLRAMRTAYHPLQTDRGWWLLAPIGRAPGNGISR